MSMSQNVVLWSIKTYQRFISPSLAPSCRFSPTCSHYAAQAVAEHGAARGLMLAIRRVLRCHPLSRGGFDPVPTTLHKGASRGR